MFCETLPFRTLLLILRPMIINFACELENATINKYRLRFFNTEAKRNFATHSDFSVYIDDKVDRLKAEKYLKLYLMHDWHFYKYYTRYLCCFETLKKDELVTASDARKDNLSFFNRFAFLQPNFEKTNSKQRRK